MCGWENYRLQETKVLLPIDLLLILLGYVLFIISCESVRILGPVLKKWRVSYALNVPECFSLFLTVYTTGIVNFMLDLKYVRAFSFENVNVSLNVV